MKTLTYYTLAVRENGVWGALFGDYNRDVVADELCEYHDNGEYMLADMKVLRTPDDQASIDFAINVLNGRFAVKEV